MLLFFLLCVSIIRFIHLWGISVSRLDCCRCCCRCQFVRTTTKYIYIRVLIHVYFALLSYSSCVYRFGCLYNWNRYLLNVYLWRVNIYSPDYGQTRRVENSVYARFTIAQRPFRRISFCWKLKTRWTIIFVVWIERLNWKSVPQHRFRELWII